MELAALVGNAEGDLFLLDAAARFFQPIGTSTGAFQLLCPVRIVGA